MNFIVTVLLVVALLGESLTPSKTAGLVLALLATWLLLGAGATADRRADDARNRSFAQVAVATLAFGAANFFHTIGLRHGTIPETLAVAQGAMFAPLATVVVYFTDRKLRPPLGTLKYSGTPAIILVGATIFFTSRCSDWPSHGAGADHPDGIRDRRPARDIYSS